MRSKDGRGVGSRSWQLFFQWMIWIFEAVSLKWNDVHPMWNVGMMIFSTGPRYD